MFYQGLGVTPETTEVLVRRLRLPLQAPAFADETWRAENAEHLSTGLVVDCETTGLDAHRDALIELAMVPFLYDRRSGTVVAYGEAFSGLEDPGSPLTPEIIALTGLTDDAVRGQHIDRKRALEILRSAAIVIAHNAGFDRPFIEGFLDVSDNERRPIWGCSLEQVDWAASGIPAAKLEVLTVFHGFFIGNHRAEADAAGTLHLLTLEDPSTGKSYLQGVLTKMREPSVLLQAFGSAFETKERLRLRGYKWHAAKRVWQKVVAKANLEAEERWLTSDVYNGKYQGIVEDIPVHSRFRHREENM